MGRAGSPIYKGEPGDYDLPFVRSFQLFCPIKISIFSPIAATLAGSPFAVSLTPPPPLPPLSTQATLHTVTSTMPNPVILPLLTLAHPVIQPPLSLHRSFFSSLSPSIALSLFFVLSLPHLFQSPPSLSLFSLCLHLRYSGFNIQLLATRALVDHSQKAGNEVAYGFCVHTNGRVCFTALLRLPSDCAIKRREIERRRENGKG